MNEKNMEFDHTHLARRKDTFDGCANLLFLEFVESHPRDAAQALEQLDITEVVGVWSRNYGLALVLFFP